MLLPVVFSVLLSAPPEDSPRPKPVDWPTLYGADDGVIRETGLKLNWGEAGPPELWRMEVGAGYSQPVVSDGKMVLFHRQGDKELLTCIEVASRKQLWEFGYTTAYVDRYGYSGGPRCTPIISGGRVYSFGAEGKLHAVDFKTGEKLWGRDLFTEYALEQAFFGVGATPILEGDRLIINLGGKTKEAGIIAVSIADGKTLWTATSDGASYATPKAATIHGKRWAFVLTEAGLVSVNPANGNVAWHIPFRSKLYESVNATSPIVVGDVVIASTSYGVGTIAVRVQPDGSYKEMWRQKKPDCHFSNIIAADGNFYSFSGRHESGAELFCCEIETGKMRWSEETPLGRGQLLRHGNDLIGWGERGTLTSMWIDPAKFRIAATTRPDPRRGLLEFPTWTPPVIYDGRMYLRNETTLLCLDLRKK